MPRPRFTIRRLMVAVAVVALVLGAARATRRRWERYRALAARHAHEAASWRVNSSVWGTFAGRVDGYEARAARGEDVRALSDCEADDPASPTGRGILAVEPGDPISRLHEVAAAARAAEARCLGESRRHEAAWRASETAW